MPGMTRLALAAAGTMAAVLAALLSARRIRRARAMTMIEHDYRRHGRLPLPPAHPAEVGLSAHRLEHISTWADGWVASGKVPGMITAIVRRGKLVYLHVCGCADVERDRPFQTNTVLRAYSMTKCVTSVVAMILYERGLFQLDEPISHFLPAFANPRVLLEDGTLVAADREITVKDLLTHTAGLGYGDGEGEIDELYAGARIGWNTPLDMSLAEFVDRLGRIPLGSHPGERWRYSYATDVLGRLLEVLSGLPLDELFEREVFAPLGMIDSCFHIHKNDTERLARFAQVYEADENETVAPSDLALQRRRYERNNAFLLHSVRNDEAAMKAAISNRDSEPKDEQISRGSSLSEISRHLGLRPSASPAKGLATAPSSPAAPSSAAPLGTRRPPGARVDLAVLSAAARPGDLDTPDHPKLLSPLAGQPVLAHVLRQLRRGGIRRVVLVIGNRGAQFQKALAALPTAEQLEITFVDLGETYTDGFARSLIAAAPYVGTDDFVLCTPDHIFDHRIIERLRNTPLRDPNAHPPSAPPAAPLDDAPASSPETSKQALVRTHTAMGYNSRAAPAMRHGEEAVRPAAVDAIVMTEDTRRFLRKRGRPPCVLGLTLRNKLGGVSAVRRTGGSDAGRDSDAEGDQPNDQTDAAGRGTSIGRAQDANDSPDSETGATAAEAYGAVRMAESISEEILVSDLLDELASPRPSKGEENTSGGGASMLPDAIEAGLYLCSPAVFDRLTDLALQLPYFTLGQGMQLVAADGKLGALDTQGYKWFAVETADQLRHHAQQLSAADYTTPPMAAATAPRAPALSPPLPLQHTVPSLTPADTLAPARAARRRYHILSLDDGGDFSDKPCFLSGGAGMLTTAHDYLRFAQCLLNDGELDGVRILSRKTVEFMRRNQLPLEGTGSTRRVDIDSIATDSGFSETTFDGIGFGLGVSVIIDPIKASLLCSKGEYGWGGWASTFFAVDPDEEMVIMSLAQLAPSDRYPLRRQLRCLVYQALLN